MNTVDPLDMSDISAVYEELLKSNKGDILVKLKDGKQLKVVSYLIKNRSSVFNTMLESSMREASTGVVDLSSQYNLEAFREFMAYIYYNKTYDGLYLPLLFEILSIADYYAVDACRTHVNDSIIALVKDVPICLMIASEALKNGTITEKIYTSCLSFLVKALTPTPVMGAVRHGGYGQVGEQPALINIGQLPDFIVNDVKSAMNGHEV